MSVDPKYRRQGIASALFERVNRIRLTVWSDNDDAQACYAASGFTTFRQLMELEP